MVGYNVQVVVDTEHQLIVAHEVQTTGHDRTPLKPMADKAKDAMGGNTLSAIADRGCFNGEQILQCDEVGIVPQVPKPLTSSGIKRGLFSKQDFFNTAEYEHYVCPAGQKLTKGAQHAL